MVTLTDISLCAAYALLQALAYVWAFKAMARTQQRLTLFALAAGAARMLTSAMFVLAYMLMVGDAGRRRTFVVAFLVCYLLTLTFDVAYFIRTQNNIGLKKNLNK